MRKPSLLIIFLTVFIDLVGFGIVLPLLPIYSRDFGANGWMIGAIMASYSAMQFLFAPVWGRLSDRVGRRPILMVSLLGSSLSYAGFAVASGMQGHTALWMLLGSRMLAGVGGANITVAQAYIADITTPEQRSRGMGLIGMAFGLGFILGPALGSISHSWLGLSGPGWVASGFCLTSLVLAWLVLPESRKTGSEPAGKRPRWDQWREVLARPNLGLLVLIFFLATFGFTCFETTLGLLLGINFGLNLEAKEDARLVGYLVAYCGLIGALVQGGAIGRLVKVLGEPKLIAVSLVLFAAGMFWLPHIRVESGQSWGTLYVALAVLAIGSQMTRPPVFGMISKLALPHEQGATLGVAQSAGSLARIAGPIFAGASFQYAPSLPYLVCAGIALATGLVAWVLLSRGAEAVRRRRDDVADRSPG